MWHSAMVKYMNFSAREIWVEILTMPCVSSVMLDMLPLSSPIKWGEIMI